MPDRAGEKLSYSIPAVLFLLAIFSRIPFASTLLYHMDSVQFALALDHYDITVHQPHPPGYFLYVMLGRLVHLFVEDANTVFVSISIFFSALTVMAVYCLGKEMFDNKTGVISALIALTSPNLWFHGEVALSYIVEAFFSTAVAFFCWKVYKGEHKYIWLSVILLGIAGGIRQNTVVFLAPLWLFSVKEVPTKKIALSFSLLGLVCAAWFTPMLQMAGGWSTYREAFRELWLFNTGYNSVFERGWPALKIFFSTLFDFTLYGIGAGIFALGLGIYLLFRHKKIKSFDMSRSLFIILWLFPSVLFYLLIFIHPANPGYALIFLPVLFILIASSVSYINNDLRRILGKNFLPLISLIIIGLNIYIFFLSKYPVSYSEIRNHDRDLAIMLNNISTFDASTTAVFTGPYVFYGYRQIMFYLPQYHVYQVDAKKARSGKIRKTFWGFQRQTFLQDTVVVPKNLDTFVIPLISEDLYKVSDIRGIVIEKLLSNISIASGPVTLISKIYTELRILPADSHLSTTHAPNN